MDPEVLDWMRHGLALAQSAAAMARRSEHESLRILRGRYEHEVLIRSTILSRLDRVDEFTPVMRAWHRYMVRKAQLQVARERRLVDDAEFHRRSSDLLRERNQQIDSWAA